MTRFPRPLLLCIVLLAAVLVAGCDMPHRIVGTPQATGQQDAILATPENQSINAIGADNGADLPHKTLLSSPFPKLDANATQAALINAVATANEQTNQLKAQLAEQKLAALQVQAQIEQSKADAEREAAANRATMAQQTQTAVDAIGNTARVMEAENEAAAIEVQRIKALRAGDDNAIMLVFCGVVFGVILLMYKAMNRPHVSVSTPAHGDNVIRPMVPTGEGPNSHHVRPLPVDPATMHAFLVHAVTGAALGKSSMESAYAWKSGKADRARHTAIMEYLIGCGHIDEDRAGKQTMNTTGINYWLDWMEKYSPASAPSDTQNADFSLHGDGLHGMETGKNAAGEGIASHFTPLPDGRFLPGDTIYNAGIDPKKDEE